jgi:acyl carrier protein
MFDVDEFISADDLHVLAERLVCTIAPVRVVGVEPNQRLIEDLGYHSLALAELKFAIEDLFNIESFGVEAAAVVERFGDILEMLDRFIKDGGGELPRVDDVAGLFARYGVPSPISR